MRKLLIVFAVLSASLFLVGLVFVYLADSDPDDQGFKDFCGEGNVIGDDLRQFYKSRKNYPAYNLDQLQQMGVFDSEARAYWVHFSPFSPDAPDDKIVLRLGYGPLGFIPQLCDLSWTKGDLTNYSDPASTPLKDKLIDVRISQAKAIATEHPGTRILSTCAWFEPNEPSTGYGELIVGYILPGQKVSHTMHYDLWQKGSGWSVGSSKLLK